MEPVEYLIPDNGGNHLVVVLTFYDDTDKIETFQIPCEFVELDIADISIEKVDLNKPLNVRAFFCMCDWLIEQFLLYPNSVFSFICSTDSLSVRHDRIEPSLYRWRLFEQLFFRNQNRIKELGINSQNIVVGSDDYKTFAKVFYRDKHTPIIHIVASHLENKYSV